MCHSSVSHRAHHKEHFIKLFHLCIWFVSELVFCFCLVCWHVQRYKINVDNIILCWVTCLSSYWKLKSQGLDFGIFGIWAETCEIVSLCLRDTLEKQSVFNLNWSPFLRFMSFLWAYWLANNRHFCLKKLMKSRCTSMYKLHSQKKKCYSVNTNHMYHLLGISLFVLPVIANFELFGVLFEVKRLNYSDEEKFWGISMKLLSSALACKTEKPDRQTCLFIKKRGFAAVFIHHLKALRFPTNLP